MMMVSSPASPPPTLTEECINPFALKVGQLAQLIGCYSVNYAFALAVLVLMYPISQQTIAPLLAAVVPLGHSSLPKAIGVLTLMYWLPILVEATRRWIKNDF
jgi:hypothetical protein